MKLKIRVMMMMIDDEVIILNLRKYLLKES